MALDGAEELWWVRANAKTYGPYTRPQMLKFLTEGRVTATTLVAPKPDGEWAEARHCRAFKGALHEQGTTFHVASGQRAAEPPQANMVVHAEFRAGSLRTFEHELSKLGLYAEVTPGLYIVRTTRTAGMMRNALSQAMQTGDKLVVVDASRDRLAWFNLGPEIDVRMRDVWNAPLSEGQRV